MVIQNASPSSLDSKIIEEMETISVIFSSPKNELYSIICLNSDSFIKVMKKLYEKCPEYKNKPNFFLNHGEKIDEYKTVEGNKIKDNDIIIFDIAESFT